MDFIHHHASQMREISRRPLIREQQQQTLRRGQQNIRRHHPLPRPPVRRRIAAPRLDRDIQPQFAHRRLQIPRDIRPQRLQRAHIERMQMPRFPRPQFNQARQKPRQRLAAPRRRNQQRIRPRLRGAQHLPLMRPHPPPFGGKPGGKILWQIGHNPPYGLFMVCSIG